MQLIEIKVPDIGDFDKVPVIEIFIKVGDKVEKEDPLIALESDKATMEVPSSEAGVVKEILVSTGDEVTTGMVIATVDSIASREDHSDDVKQATDIENKLSISADSGEPSPTNSPATRRDIF